MVTTLSVQEDTKERFDRLKPYKSLNQDEFVEELLDCYEEECIEQ